MDTRALLLQAIQAAPGDELAWRALADHLEEQGQPERAELLRLTLSLTRSINVPDRPERQRRAQELLESGVRPLMPAFEVVAGLRMVLIPPGSYLRGSPENETARYENEGPQHKVTLTRGFYLSACPVTQTQWRAVTGRWASAPTTKGDWPVEHVSWHDCQDFCAKLGEKFGQPFRLPTEAEWEHACRAGTQTGYFSGDDLEALKKVGWCSYDGTYPGDQQARPVGQFQPNAFGLFDMHGNVWEWCEDSFGPYRKRALTDPCRKAPRGARVVRGGSWRFPPRYCRSAYRGGVEPAERRPGWGCRVALSA